MATASTLRPLLRSGNRSSGLTRGHPLARGLLAYVPMTEAAGPPRDLVTGQLLTASDALNPRWRPSPGRGVLPSLSPTGDGSWATRCYDTAPIPRYAVTTNAYTLACWLYLDAADWSGNGSYGISPFWFSPYQATPVAALWSPSGNWSLYEDTGTDSTLTTGVHVSLMPPVRTWFHMAGTRDASGNGVFYVNGISRGTATIPGTFPSSTTMRLTVLNRTWRDSGWPGYLQHVGVWNRALRPDELLQLVRDPPALLVSRQPDNPRYWSTVAAAPPQVAAPISDVSTGGWTVTPLWSKLDETVADDADYVSSSLNPVADTGEVLLAPTSVPVNMAGHTLSIRAGYTGPGPVNLTLSLVQGSTVIATTTYTGIASAFTTLTLTLSEGEAATITDRTDLRARWSATKT
jgi:hypothetical protein